MSALVPLLVFSLESLRLAVPVGSVLRVVHACEVTPLSGAPAQVLGAINLQGVITPVLDLRHRLRLPPRPLRAGDRLLILRVGERDLGVVVDDADGVREFVPEQIVAADTIADGVAQLQGVVQLEDGLLLIEDPARFLTLQDERQLERALEQEGGYVP